MVEGPPRGIGTGAPEGRDPRRRYPRPVPAGADSSPHVLPWPVPPRSALVVVDVQRGFLNDHTRDVAGRIADLLRTDGHRFAVVVASRFVNEQDSLFRRVLESRSMTAPEEIELCPGIAADGLVVLDKTGYSAFDERLVRVVHEHGVERLYLCGVDTDQCVLHTALDAWDARVRPLVLGDWCASAGGPDQHEAALTILRRAIGVQSVLGRTP